jgi:hypothetical protein
MHEPSPPRAPYEFSDGDRETLSALAASASFVGVCVVLGGALLGIFGAGALFAGFPSAGGALLAGGMAMVIEGWWTMYVGRSLTALVVTRGRDVDHLMNAVEHLRRLFAFWRITVIALALLGAAGAALVLWCGVSATDHGGRCPAVWWR